MGAHRWSRVRRAAVASAVAAAATVALVVTPSGGTPAEAAPGDLLWSDEFDRAAGSLPDPGKWQIEQGGGGWGNNEHQYYTDRAENVSHDGNGNLAITARAENPNGYQCWYGSCRYTSARITTADRYTPQYGKVEARIKIPRGQGIWPAFWSLGTDIGQVGWPASGEIDVMENVGYEPHLVHGTVHGPGYSGGEGISASYMHPQGWSFADDFHVFAIDWAPDRITWSVDGVAYRTVTPADTGGDPWVFNHPFFLILNVAVGGNWPGYPDGSTQFPQTMLVDYVRVYQN